MQVCGSALKPVTTWGSWMVWYLQMAQLFGGGSHLAVGRAQYALYACRLCCIAAPCVFWRFRVSQSASLIPYQCL